MKHIQYRYCILNVTENTVQLTSPPFPTYKQNKNKNSSIKTRSKATEIKEWGKKRYYINTKQLFLRIILVPTLCVCVWGGGVRACVCVCVYVCVCVCVCVCGVCKHARTRWTSVDKCVLIKVSFRDLCQHLEKKRKKKNSKDSGIIWIIISSSRWKAEARIICGFNIMFNNSFLQKSLLSLPSDGSEIISRNVFTFLLFSNCSFQI